MTLTKKSFDELADNIKSIIESDHRNSPLVKLSAFTGLTPLTPVFESYAEDFDNVEELIEDFFDGIWDYKFSARTPTICIRTKDQFKELTHEFVGYCMDDDDEPEDED